MSSSDRLANLLKKRKYTIQELAEITKLSEKKIRRKIDKLIDRGYEIRKERRFGKKTLYYIPYPDDQLEIDIPPVQKIGIVSDTHLGNKKARVDLLHKMYKIFEAEDVDLIIHAGDVTDGDGRVYKGQLNELKVYGFDETLDYLINEYPYSRIKTYLITGNHDDSFIKSTGANIVKQATKYRDDFVYCGEDGARLKAPNLVLEVVHGKGGNSYARSYKSQRQLEQMTDRPDILIRGHHHISLFMPYLESVIVEAGCFQDQTNYEKRQGLYPQVGGWILEIDGLIKSSWYPKELL